MCVCVCTHHVYHMYKYICVYMPVYIQTYIMSPNNISTIFFATEVGF